MTSTPDQIPRLVTVANMFNDIKPQFFNGLLISFIVAVIFVLIIARQKHWKDFSLHHKWSSRLILLVLSLFIAVPALFLPANAVSDLMFGKIAMESPNLTATAIKLGLYGRYRNYEISGQVAPEQRDLVSCVTAISSMEAQSFQKKCGDDQTCYTNIPVMTRTAIIAKIKEASSTSSSEAYRACKDFKELHIN